MPQSPSRDKHLPNPLAFSLRLLPVNARLLMLGVAGVLTLLAFLLFSDILDNFEERVAAQGWKLGASAVTEQRLTIVAIDERSLAQVGPWPWPRETMAQLSTAISDAGAQLQLLDLVFPEAKPGDDRLLEALSSTPALMAQIPVLNSTQSIQAGQMSHPLGGINCNSSLGGQNATQNFLASHSGFASVPKGHITHAVASDGAVRKIPAVVCVEGSAYPALAISALLMAGGDSQWSASVRAGEGLFGPAQLLELDSYPGLSIPLDAQGNLRISYRNLPETYQAVSAADVLNGTADTRLLDNTWVLIGATAFGMGDIVPTPYAGATPGVELQARMLGSLLDTQVPYTPRSASLLLLGLSVVFGLALVLLAGARERIATYGLPLASLLLPAFALGLHVALLNGSGIWLGWLMPALFSVCAAALLLLLELSRVRMERSRVFGNLNAYLPSDVARDIAYSLPSSSINARRCDVTLLSADLRNFSAYSEARPPEESAALLHYFFVRATEIIEQNHGSLHEFKGDGLLAIWNNADSEAAARALKAARQMQVSIQRDMLPQHPPGGLEPLGLGIGIEQGPALIGSIGPAHRRSHTLLGDTVTITLRIQEMTAELAQPILIGDVAARQLQGHNLESQGSYLLGGLRIPQVLHAPPMEGAPYGGPADGSAHTSPYKGSKTELPGLKVVSGGRQ